MGEPCAGEFCGGEVRGGGTHNPTPELTIGYLSADVGLHLTLKKKKKPNGYLSVDVSLHLTFPKKKNLTVISRLMLVFSLKLHKLAQAYAPGQA